MKSAICVLTVVGAMASFSAFAKAKPPKACHKIEKACKKAKLKKHADCYDKLLNGETVDNVTVDQKDVDACKAAKK